MQTMKKWKDLAVLKYMLGIIIVVIYLSVYLSIYLFVCLFIYLFIYLFIKIYFMLTLVYKNLAVILHQEMANMLICVVTDTR